jgi:hypothetical protein
MTLDDIKRQLKDEIKVAADAEEAARAALRRAEIQLAYVRGQFDALNQIQAEQPIYSEGEDPPA